MDARVESVTQHHRPHRIPVRTVTTYAPHAAPPWERWLNQAARGIPLLHLLLTLVFAVIFLGPVLLPARFAPWQNLFVDLVWGVWFPLTLLSVLVTGRTWCGWLCPMGACSQWASHKGLNWKIPVWLSWPGTPIVSFIAVTVLGQTLAVRDYHDTMALLFGGVFGLAVLIGFLYGRKKRVWCRHACPIGLLLGVFSRLGPVDFTPKRKRGTEEGYTLKGPCPTLIDIHRKRESRHCIECFGCVYPDTRGGLRVKLRRPGREAEAIRYHHPNRSEMWFLFFGIGVVLGGFLWLSHPLYTALRTALGNLLIEHQWFALLEPGPWWLMSVHPAQREVFYWLDFIAISGFMLGVMGLIAVVLYLCSYGAARVVGSSELTAKALQTELVYQYLPVAVVSLLMGLGGQFLQVLDHRIAIQLTLLLTSFIWSLWLGYQILRQRAAGGLRLVLSLQLSALGSLFIAWGWYLALMS